MAAAHVILLVVLVIAAAADFRSHRIPNWLTYSGLLLCIAAAGVESGWGGLAGPLLGIFVCGGLMLTAWWSKGVGGGDVKLAAVMGGALGWAEGLYALMWTFTLAAVWMMSVIVWQEGASGLWRFGGGSRATAGSGPASGSRIISLAPAALAAVILITWPG